MSKLVGATVTTDTCTPAQKARRDFCLKLDPLMVGGIIYQQDCMNHLRCVWCKQVEIELCKVLQVIVMDTMDEIAPELRVSCLFSAYARSYGKFFSLTCNYAKGKGEDFAEFVKEKFPGDLLFHIEDAQGSRHDLPFIAAPAIFMNRLVCLEYACYLLRVPKKKDSILLKNLACLMTSNEIVALSRLFSILFISVVLPMHWLAGSTASLAEWNWGAE